MTDQRRKLGKHAPATQRDIDIERLFRRGAVVNALTRRNLLIAVMVAWTFSLLYSQEAISRLDTNQATPVEGRAITASYLTDRRRRGLEVGVSLPVSQQFGLSANTASFKRFTTNERSVRINEIEIALDWAPPSPLESIGFDLEIGVVGSRETSDVNESETSRELFVALLVSHEMSLWPISLDGLLEHSVESGGGTRVYDERFALEAAYAISDRTSFAVGWEHGYRNSILRRLRVTVRAQNHWRIGVDLRRRSSRWAVRISTRRAF